ncbi:MAG: pseudouridine synthase, partial [Moraxellaceae bacterium]
MGISKYPSKTHLPHPNPGFSTVFEYLIEKFSAIEVDVWRSRITDGKVHWLNGELIGLDTVYRSQQCVCYYREVEREPVIPFQESIVFQNEHILVADKPHFLPVTPGGKYVDECLQNRLRKKTGIDSLQALHRLDRETAGLVLFSKKEKSRPQYHELFAQRKIQKTYSAIAEIKAGDELVGQEWCVKNRIVESNPKFLMQIVDGEINSHSIIRCVSQDGTRALFELLPVTGKTHQLRLHMQSLGWPILNDKFYPQLLAETADKFSSPLQLLAKELQFVDPITQ